MRLVIFLLALTAGFASSQQQSFPTLKGAPIPYPIVGIYNDGSYQIILYLAGKDRNDQNVTGVIARNFASGKTLWKKYARFMTEPELNQIGRGKGVIVADSRGHFEGCPSCVDYYYIFRLHDGFLLKSDDFRLAGASNGFILTLPIISPQIYPEWLDLDHEIIYESININTGKSKFVYYSLPDRNRCGRSTIVSEYSPVARWGAHVEEDSIIFDGHDKCGDFFITVNWTTFPNSMPTITSGKSKFRINSEANP